METTTLNKQGRHVGFSHLHTTIKLYPIQLLATSHTSGTPMATSHPHGRGLGQSLTTGLTVASFTTVSRLHKPHVSFHATVEDCASRSSVWLRSKALRYLLGKWQGMTDRRKWRQVRRYAEREGHSVHLLVDSYELFHLGELEVDQINGTESDELVLDSIYDAY